MLFGIILVKVKKNNDNINFKKSRNRINSQNTSDMIQNYLLKTKMLDFPGGTVVKNPPANAGDTGLSPGLGRSHCRATKPMHQNY